MLQISSKKFFDDSSQINAREQHAVLFSNYHWVAPISTLAATLFPADVYSVGVASYALKYVNRYQRSGPTDIMVNVGGNQAVEQFALLASFWFRALFHFDRHSVEILRRTAPLHSSDTTVPSKFAPRVFDACIHGTNEEVEGFVKFVDKVIGMPRKQYNLLIKCLQSCFGVFEIVGTSFDLAYTLFVYVLEALSKSSGDFQPTWDDYDQNLRPQFDEIFKNIDPQNSEAIKSLLLSTPHQKLRKRFIEFTVAHVSDSFFTVEAENRQPALRKNELQRALINLYRARSGYVHDLEEVQENLKIAWSTTADVFRWMNEPFLTFSGLFRLVHHVILTFVHRQPSLDKENYPWRSELPGIVHGEFAPEYWVANPGNFQPHQAKKKLSGMLAFSATRNWGDPMQFLDMSPLVTKIEELIDQASSDDKPAMLAIYHFFHVLVEPSKRRPDWDKFLDRYQAEIKCCIELMVVFILTGVELPWPLSDCEQEYEAYLKQKFKKNAVNLPAAFEAVIQSQFANMHFDRNELEDFKTWTDRAILDSAGHKQMQAYLETRKQSSQRIDWLGLLGLPVKTKSSDEALDESPRTES